MSIASCADLKAAIASFLNRANLSLQIPTFIQLAESRIAYGSQEGQFLCEPLRVRGMESSADVAISGQTAALPQGYLQVRRFYVNCDPIQELGYIVPDLFWRTYVSVCAGLPTRFTVEGENFVFGPTPDAAYTGKILYYQKFAPLVNDSDTNWLLANAPGIYLHGALMEGYRFTRNMDKAMDEHSAFCGAINALNLADKADRFAGSPWQAFGDTGNP